jgi:hypothetical protein
MANKVCFTEFDPLVGDSPEFCDLCRKNPPIFRYQCSSAAERESREYLFGYCCLPCTRRLLDRLQQSESRSWAAEEAALTEDDADIIAFHQRRIASFARR